MTFRWLRVAMASLAFGGAAYVTACASTPANEEESVAEAQQGVGGVGEACSYNSFTNTYYCNSGLNCCTTTGGGFTLRRCRDFTNDSNNCGSCGNACTGGKVCSGGTCQCPAGQTFCGGVCVNTATDTNNCGTCGHQCSFAHASASCSGGSCVMGSCDAGWSNCNANTADGCETHSAVDVNNCNTCGNACAFAHAGASCSGGSCVMGTCDAGWKNCNSNTADGCEVNTNSDPNNCGGCGKVCGSGQTCTAGACTCGSDGDCSGLGAGGRCCTDSSRPNYLTCLDILDPCNCGRACLGPTGLPYCDAMNSNICCYDGATNFACVSSCGGLQSIYYGDCTQ